MWVYYIFYGFVAPYSTKLFFFFHFSFILFPSFFLLLSFLVMLLVCFFACFLVLVCLLFLPLFLNKVNVV